VLARLAASMEMGEWVSVDVQMKTASFSGC
jgi:hypothetical protein